MIVNTTNKFVPIISNLIFSPLSNPLVFRRKNGEKFSYNIEKNNRCSLKMNLNDLDEFKDSELDPETKKLKEKKAEIERLRAAEKFMEINEGKFECQACGYLYEPEKGDKFAGIQPGTEFEDLPGNFSCPACRSPKSQFKGIKKVIAGFAENQKYGFGGNSLTGGQKNLLIFGFLGFAFLLLLSGYFLE
jgi:rubredoxin